VKREREVTTFEEKTKKQNNRHCFRYDKKKTGLIKSNTHFMSILSSSRNTSTGDVL
jgi:hypothetical protein